MTSTDQTTDRVTSPTPAVTRSPGTAGALLTPSEVAALFRVDPKTVTRWANTGRLDAIRTLGGHRRYPAAQFAHLLDRAPTHAATAPAELTAQEVPA